MAVGALSTPAVGAAPPEQGAASVTTNHAWKLCSNTATITSNDRSRQSFDLNFLMVNQGDGGSLQGYHTVCVSALAVDSITTCKGKAPGLGELVVKVDGERRLVKNYAKAHRGSATEFAAMVGAVTPMFSSVVGIPFVHLVAKDMYRRRITNWRQELQTACIHVADGVSLQLGLGWRADPSIKGWSRSAADRSAWFLDYVDIELDNGDRLPRFTLGTEGCSSPWAHVPCPIQKAISFFCIVSMDNTHGKMPINAKMNFQDAVKFSRTLCDTVSTAEEVSETATVKLGGEAKIGMSCELGVSAKEARLASLALTTMHEDANSRSGEVSLGAGPGERISHKVVWSFTFAHGLGTLLVSAVPE